MNRSNLIKLMTTNTIITFPGMVRKKQYAQVVLLESRINTIITQR